MFTIKRDVVDTADRPPMRELTPETVINAIRNGWQADKIALIRAGQHDVKQQLPQFFPVTFKDPTGNAALDNIAQVSGVMVFDLDGLNEGQAAELKAVLLASRLRACVSFIFESPRRGLKIGLQTDINQHLDLSDPYRANKLHAFVYKRIAALLVKVGMPEQEIDGQTCNLNRGQLVSHDPTAYFDPCPRCLPVKAKWIDEFNAEQAEIQRQIAAQREQQALMEYDRKHADRYVEKAFTNITRTMGAGDRHLKVFQIGSMAYRAGYEPHDVEALYNRLKWSGHWTEGMSTHAKAMDVYRSWQRDGCQVDDRFFKPTTESRIKAYSMIED